MFKRKVEIVSRKEEEEKYVFDRDNRFVPPHPLKSKRRRRDDDFFVLI